MLCDWDAMWLPVRDPFMTIRLVLLDLAVETRAPKRSRLLIGGSSGGGGLGHHFVDIGSKSKLSSATTHWSLPTHVATSGLLGFLGLRP